MRALPLLLAALVASLAGCERRSAAGASDTNTAGSCRMTTDEGEPLLLEQWVERRPAPPSGLRVTTDGTVLQRTIPESGPQEGRPVFDARWTEVGTLSPEALARMQSLLESGFAGLSPSYRFDGAVLDAPTETWTACVGGTKKIVKVEGGPLAEAPAVDAFRKAVQDLVKTAR